LKPAARSGLCALLALLLGACTTVADNAPRNLPETSGSRAAAMAPRDVVGRNVVALSLSGGGLRASAFALGVLQGLADTPTGPDPRPGEDLFGDLSFISAVSGGSLTATYIGLHGRAGLARLRNEVLVRDFERDLRLSMLLPANLLRLVAGGLNDRSNFGATLDADVFKGATFADLWRARKPDVWINATDLFNRTPFPFIPPVFAGLCSDLSRLPLAEAVAASMAVPLAFAPVLLRTHPEACTEPLPAWVASEAEGDPAGVAAGVLASTARAVRNYRDPQRMRYVKLADGGLTDNQGLASILIARAVAGDDIGPFQPHDAVRVSRMLFLIVDAGRPPSGDWALAPEGPSGVDIGIAAADAAIDSATRLSAASFRTMVQGWREAIVRFRCAQPRERVAALLGPGRGTADWRCDDVVFSVATLGFASLPREQAERLRAVPTRLTLPAADIDFAVAAGRDAVRSSPAVRDYLAARLR
jgi:NTE family protein